jgi:hypothetical protein
MSESEELTLLFNAFWLSFTFAFVICCYYETTKEDNERENL